MQLVIDIPDDSTKLIEECIKFDNMVDLDIYDIVLNGIKNGTPLPKGHGRLIDADELLKAMDTWDKFGFEHTGCFVRNPEDDFIKYVHYDDMVKSVRGAPTIIEADADKEAKDAESNN